MNHTAHFEDSLAADDLLDMDSFLDKDAFFEEELFQDEMDFDRDLHHMGEPRSQGSSEPDYAVGSPAPNANQGRTGSILHWRLVDRIAQDLARRGYRDIRVDQQQVAGGRIIGENRPDIQATSPSGQHVIYEVDTQQAQRQLHEGVVTGLLRQHDPNSRAIFLQIDPRTGAIQQRRVYDTPTGRWSTQTFRRPTRTAVGPRRSTPRGQLGSNRFLGL